MITTIHPIPAFTDNYLWLLHSDDEQSACVVDPGDAKAVIDYLELQGLNLTHILVTHHHPDHVGGLRELVDRYAPIVYGPESSGIKGISHFVSEADTLCVFDNEFEVIEVPGHTLDHLAYYCRAPKRDVNSNSTTPLLFCGDTLFAAGCGRLFEGTPAQMFTSLGKLSTLPADTAVYCTHEYTLANLKFAKAADPSNKILLQRIETETGKRVSKQPTLPSNVQLELDTNPFLRCSNTSLVESLSTQTGKQYADDIEVFAALRSWKDNF